MSDTQLGIWSGLRKCLRAKDVFFPGSYLVEHGACNAKLWVSSKQKLIEYILLMQKLLFTKFIE